MLAKVLDRLHCDWSVVPASEPDPFLHPGRAGRIILNGLDAGWIGDLHPLVAAEWGLGGAAAFELDIAAVVDAVPDVVHFTPLSPHPEVVQDLAIVVDSSVPAAEVVAVASSAGGAELESISVFDVFSGDQLGEGLVSIGLRLVFRSADRTLTEEEASRSRQDIVDALQAEKGASVRG